MFRIQVQPVSGHELALQQRFPFQQSSQFPRLDAIRYLNAILFGSHLTGIGASIIVGFVSIALSGCGGLVLNQGSTGGQSGASKSGSSNPPTLGRISCGSQSLTGAQTQGCSVYLNSPATSSVFVSLSSNNPAVTVPTTITVAVGATSSGFSAVSSNVSSPQSVTLTATAAGASTTTVIQLYPAPTSAAPGLSMISCETQSLTGPTTKGCSVYLSSAATSATLVTLSSSSRDLAVPGTVTIAAGAASAGFSATASAVTTPETVTLTASSGGVSVTSVVQLNSTSSSSPLPSIQHVVDLSWSAPASGDSVAGYHVYRSAGGASDFQLLNSSVETQTAYVDSTVASGQTYDYEVKSVSTTGLESAPSNTTSVTIP